MDSLKVCGIIVIVALIMVLIWMLIVLNRYIKLKQRQIENEIEYRSIRKENQNKTVEYSNQVLEFVRSIVGQVAVLKFRTFTDTHDLTKITKAHLQPLVTDVATMVKDSINIENISIGEALFTKDFYEKYIIETSVIMIKQMWETAIEDQDEV